MKKIISFIIAVGMSLGCINFAYSEEMVIDVSSVEEKFSALGISLDDTFQGENISRGDFARLMIEYLNLTLDNSEEYTRFIDVDTSHKAVGAINRLCDLGYVAGYGEYRYYPERNITYAEALSIIINAFGYKHIVSNSNNWIGGVSNVADDLDIMDGVFCDINDAAKKPQLLKILDNALEAEVMTVSFGDEIKKTLAIEQFHKVYVLENIVTGNKYTSLVSRNEGRKDNVLYINNTEIIFENDYSDFLGNHAKCYYKNDDGELTGLYIEKTKRNNYVEIDGDDVQAFDANGLSYIDEEGKLRKYSVDNIKIIYNNVAYTEYGQLSGIVFPNTSVKLLDNDIDSILGPGINIHRSPLNGRNFEYFSEDPFLTGKIAAAVIQGVSEYGNSATVKHFALNSQEYMRRDVNAVVSERAIREIYLKGFEIAIKEGKTTSLMTSYNPINEHWSANNYELNTKLLRNEWGYEGFVVTDWWPKLSKENSEVLNLKEMVEAQNDVYMPVSDAATNDDNLAASLQKGEISRAQLQRNAKNVLRYIMKSHSQKRFIEFGGKLEKSLAEDLENLNIWTVVENPENDKEIKVNLPDTGRVLLGIEYESDEPEISQMVINVYLQKVSAASITVNGTCSESIMIYRDISTAFQTLDFKIKYPQKQLRVKKIVVFGKNMRFPN